jgi:hypothetical protein
MAMAPILPYLLDLAPHEFFLFEQWNCSYRDVTFKMSLKFRNSCCLSHTWF